MNELIEKRKTLKSEIAEAKQALASGESRKAINIGLKEMELKRIEGSLISDGIDLDKIDREEKEKANRSRKTVYKFGDGKLTIEI